MDQTLLIRAGEVRKIITTKTGLASQSFLCGPCNGKFMVSIPNRHIMTIPRNEVVECSIGSQVTKFFSNDCNTLAQTVVAAINGR